MGAATSAARKVGRYEILGRLATGGMAEVLLARLRGPRGFERAVVVKRILPHLAIDRSVVELFLDEARIIASLRHPNLINVHELGEEDGEFFIVMDFLEGETVAGLSRRLAMRGELLDFDLAAYIAAEACAGLHAAHEAKSPDGRPLGIVHRDVSPQNVFVTYSGGVHVIDFGIAVTADRGTRTEVGTLRGKMQYVAPEQIQSMPVDRRADVFALGIVLLELASGRRLYRRESQAATLAAIMNEPAPPLDLLRPGAPHGLAEICARALAKSRRDRYQDASAMRKALLAFLRKRSDDDLGESLARRMREVFPERVKEKAELLRLVQTGSVVETMPAAEVDVQVEIPTVEHAAMGTALSQSVPIVATSPRRRRRMKTVALGAIAATAMVFAGAMLDATWRRSKQVAGTSATAPSHTVAPEASFAPPPAAEPSPPASATPTAGAALAATVTPEKPTPRGNGIGARPPHRAAPAISASSRVAPPPKPEPTLW